MHCDKVGVNSTHLQTVHRNSNLKGIYTRFSVTSVTFNLMALHCLTLEKSYIIHQLKMALEVGVIHIEAI